MDFFFLMHQKGHKCESVVKKQSEIIAKER
jgi:hypothetical protein